MKAGCYSAMIDLIGIVLAGQRYRTGLRDTLNIVAHHSEIQRALELPAVGIETDAEPEPSEDGRADAPSEGTGTTGSTANARKKRKAQRQSAQGQQSPRTPAPPSRGNAAQQISAVSESRTTSLLPLPAGPVSESLDPTSHIMRWIAKSGCVKDPNDVPAVRDEGDAVAAL